MAGALVNASEVHPLQDRVLVRILTEEAVTTGGIIIPDNAKERPTFADVVSIGPDVTGVKVGERVVFAKYSGNEIKVEDAGDHLLLHEEDLIGVVEGVAV